MPQFLTFKIPENLLFCFCAYPEVLSLGRTDEKCFILTEVHTDSPSRQEAQPDQAFLETAYGIPQRHICDKCAAVAAAFLENVHRTASRLSIHTAVGDTDSTHFPS